MTNKTYTTGNYNTSTIFTGHFKTAGATIDFETFNFRGTDLSNVFLLLFFLSI